jgi:hypothetical protein
LFEQGWLGVIALGLFAATVLAQACGRILRGDVFAAVIAASVIAFLFTATFDSLFEAPRIATLFYLVCFLAWCSGPETSPTASSATASRTGRGQ